MGNHRALAVELEHGRFVDVSADKSLPDLVEIVVPDNLLADLCLTVRLADLGNHFRLRTLVIDNARHLPRANLGACFHRAGIG